MKVSELRKSIQDAPDEAEVVFQGNVSGEDDGPDEATYTTVIGNVFSVFVRTGLPGNDEFVIDGAITDQE